jgi:hypothetical protein
MYSPGLDGEGPQRPLGPVVYKEFGQLPVVHLCIEFGEEDIARNPLGSP